MEETHLLGRGRAERMYFTCTYPTTKVGMCGIGGGRSIDWLATHIQPDRMGEEI